MIFLVRHGQTNWNRTHRVQGVEDIPLNPSGILQAEMLKEAFNGTKLAALITSPLTRAQQTGRLIANECEIGEIKTDERLQERDFGELSGRQMPVEPKKPLHYFYKDYRGEGAEDPDELYKRVNEAVEDIAKEYGDKPVLIVSHGAALGSFLSRKIGNDDFYLANTGVLAVDPKTLEVVGYNLTTDEIKSLLKKS